MLIFFEELFGKQIYFLLSLFHKVCIRIRMRHNLVWNVGGYMRC